MAPPFTGESLILHPRILPNGIGADTTGAVIANCPSGALHSGGDHDDQTRCVGSAMPHDRHGDGLAGEGPVAHVEISSGFSPGLRVPGLDGTRLTDAELPAIGDRSGPTRALVMTTPGDIRYARTSDGIDIAHTAFGAGPDSVPTRRLRGATAIVSEAEDGYRDDSGEWSRAP
jgi:hypothetical protein